MYLAALLLAVELLSEGQRHCGICLKVGWEQLLALSVSQGTRLRSLWAELASTARLRLLLPSPAGSEAALVGAPLALQPYQHPTSVKKDPSPSAGVLQGKPRNPGSLPPPGEPLPALFRAHPSISLPLLRVFCCTVATHALPARTPSGSQHSCPVSAVPCSPPGRARPAVHAAAPTRRPAPSPREGDAAALAAQRPLLARGSAPRPARPGATSAPYSRAGNCSAGTCWAWCEGGLRVCLCVPLCVPLCACGDCVSVCVHVGAVCVSVCICLSGSPGTHTPGLCVHVEAVCVSVSLRVSVCLSWHTHQ